MMLLGVLLNIIEELLLWDTNQWILDPGTVRLRVYTESLGNSLASYILGHFNHAHFAFGIVCKDRLSSIRRAFFTAAGVNPLWQPARINRCQPCR